MLGKSNNSKREIKAGLVNTTDNNNKNIKLIDIN